MYKGNVLIIGSAHPLRGGLATYNERLAREYSNQGFNTTIETFKLQYPSILFPGKTQYSNEPTPCNIKINVSINSINPLNWYTVGTRLKKMRPDLVVIKYWIPFMAPCLGTLARRIKKNNHSKVISILDNVIPHEHRPGDKSLTKFFISSVDGFIAMSKSVLNDLRLFTETKPGAFCPHPLYDNFGKVAPKEVALNKLGLDADFRYLLFFGFIRDYKGLDLLLKAMAQPEISDQNIKLLVAGEFYTDSKPYFNLIDALNIGEKVIMLNDFIPDSKVADYFNACDIVVQPYKSATQSGVTQIAYHFNKPMIITDVGGLSEIVPHNKVGYVVNPDPSVIARSIAQFYAGNKEEEFSKNVTLEKSKYSWQRMIETIDNVYRQIE